MSFDCFFVYLLISLFMSFWFLLRFFSILFWFYILIFCFGDGVGIVCDCDVDFFCVVMEVIGFFWFMVCFLVFVVCLFVIFWGLVGWFVVDWGIIVFCIIDWELVGCDVVVCFFVGLVFVGVEFLIDDVWGEFVVFICFLVVDLDGIVCDILILFVCGELFFILVIFVLLECCLCFEMVGIVRMILLRRVDWMGFLMWLFMFVLR